jgi:hypothetical protein
MQLHKVPINCELRVIRITHPVGPPPCSKRRSVNGYYKRCLRFSHWQTTVMSLPMICLGQILRLRAVLFEP